MSYFPLLTAPGCTGWTTVFNFAPNNWEEGSRVARFLHVSWTDGVSWQARQLGQLQYGESRNIEAADLQGVVPSGCLPLLSLTDEPLPTKRDKLSTIDTPHTSYPNWRATLGLQAASGARTCYQGEVDPFPAPGSLLSFCPFLQFGSEIQNYLILLNIEKSAALRQTKVEIYDSVKPEQPRGVFESTNNSATVIALDDLDFGPTQLPLIIARKMSAIPLYLSRTRDGSCLSLEHTHPPASYVIHGQRWGAQKILKNIWFSRTSQ